MNHQLSNKRQPEIGRENHLENLFCERNQLFKTFEVAFESAFVQLEADIKFNYTLNQVFSSAPQKPSWRKMIHYNGSTFPSFDHYAFGAFNELRLRVWSRATKVSKMFRIAFRAFSLKWDRRGEKVYWAGCHGEGKLRIPDAIESFSAFLTASGKLNISQYD